MELRQKLTILADAAKYDASCASSGGRRRPERGKLGSVEGTGICHSYTPDGRCISLLKILLTNYCIYDCQFCVNRVSSDTPRARFAVNEVVKLTLDFYRRNYIEGLFLSSGIIRSPDYTQEQLNAVARALREEHGYQGYIHLKTIPGADQKLLDEAGLWADRLSVNIELPTQTDLQQLAPEKDRQEITGTMDEIHQRHDHAREERRTSRHAPRYAPAGQSTQMVIGATPTADRQIVETASELYRSYNLRRVYYSAYSPIPHADARLPSQTPPLVREHRLYQADWLLRFYGFTADEICTDEEPNLSLEFDPKLAWALRNRHRFPVDLNKADRELLLRVPGIGARNVGRILKIRRYQAIRLADLQKLRVALNRARPFIITADHNPAALQLDRQDLPDRLKPRDKQLMLFETKSSAASGEL